MPTEFTISTLKELMETRLAAMDKALEKADGSLKSAEFLRRTEADAEFKRLRELIDAQTSEIAGLRESRSAGEGESAAQAAARAATQTNTRWLIALVVTILLAAVGFFLSK